MIPAPLALALIVRVTLVDASAEAPIPEQASARVLTSCQTALGQGSCVPAQDGGPPLGSDDLVARVELGSDFVVVVVTRSDFRQERRLAFVPADGPEQRYMAAGLLVAALAASAPALEAEPAPPSGEVRLTPQAFTLAPAALGSWTFDAGFITSPVWDSGAWTWGGELRTTFFPGSSWLGLTSSGRLLQAAGAPLESLWLSGSLGLSASVLRRSSALELWLLAEGVLESVRLTATQGGEQETRSVGRAGGRLGLRLGWAHLPVRPWLGAEVAALGPPIELQLSGAPLAQTSMFQLGFSLGLRFQLLGGEP